MKKSFFPFVIRRLGGLRMFDATSIFQSFDRLKHAVHHISIWRDTGLHEHSGTVYIRDRRRSALQWPCVKLNYAFLGRVRN